MKITIKHDQSTIDPSGAITEDQFPAALATLEAAYEAAILEGYPDAEIAFENSNDPESLAIEGNEDDASNVQAILERVYEAGEFWPSGARSFYVCSDSESEEITASSIDEAAEKFGIPSESEIADGAFLVVRDEETYQEKTWGTVPR